MQGTDEMEDDFALNRLIEAVENQIVDGHPREAGLVMMQLLEMGIARRTILTAMAETLAEHISQAFARQRAFDVNAYAAALLSLAENPLADNEDA